jgi:FkbM family methyltransferase
LTCDVLGYDVYLRPGSSDAVVYGETFDGLFHVPPEFMDPPSTVLDLGSNIGLTAAHFQVLWPEARVVAVEPDAGNAMVCRRNFRGEVLEVAVSPYGGRGRMSDAQEYARAFVPGTGEVVGMSLRELVDHMGGSVDFVKMDIEGMEWSVFTFDELERVGALLVELHRDSWSDERMVREAQIRLASRGFLSMPHMAHPRAVFAWRA